MIKTLNKTLLTTSILLISYTFACPPAANAQQVNIAPVNTQTNVFNTMRQTQMLAEKNFSKTKLVKPSTPKNFRGTPGDSTVTLKWAVAKPAAVTGYVLNYKTKTSKTWTKKVLGKTNTVTIRFLKNGTPYIFKIAAKNKKGISGYTPQIKTTPYKPSEPAPTPPKPAEKTNTTSKHTSHIREQTSHIRKQTSDHNLGSTLQHIKPASEQICGNINTGK